MNETRRLIAVAVFSVIVLLFNIILFPMTEINNPSEGLIMLDLRSSYDLNYVLKLFGTIGTGGRLHYLYFLVADTIYIYAYFMLSWHVIIFLQRNIGKLGVLTAFLRFSAIPAVLFDISENINTLLLLLNFPEITDKMVSRGSVVSMLKWYCVSGLVLIVISYTFYLLLRQLFWILRNKINIIQPTKNT